MVEGNISQEFRLKNIDKQRNYFLEEIQHNKVCADLNYIEHLLVLASATSGCISISALASLFGVPIVYL